MFVTWILYCIHWTHIIITVIRLHISLLSCL